MHALAHMFFQSCDIPTLLLPLEIGNMRVLERFNRNELNINQNQGGMYMQGD
jgi:hypothetical protein